MAVGSKVSKFLRRRTSSPDSGGKGKKNESKSPSKEPSSPPPPPPPAESSFGLRQPAPVSAPAPAPVPTPAPAPAPAPSLAPMQQLPPLSSTQSLTAPSVPGIVLGDLTPSPSGSSISPPSLSNPPSRGTPPTPLTADLTQTPMLPVLLPPSAQHFAPHHFNDRDYDHRRLSPPQHMPVPYHNARSDSESKSSESEQSNGPERMIRTSRNDPLVPQLKDTHFHCYQSHRNFAKSENKYCPTPCMACLKVDQKVRYRCTFCCLRICRECVKNIEKSRSRSLTDLMDNLERQYGAEKVM
ncbi:hypothetical protein AAP_02636 [Ascosphaera apis ARSEF 7405]|uniref:Uncharacterized protein n=1 Tax=Ascosphaera apis ARSEF 7405 TaxID=392613 RepID=A0A166NY24_9EURO|nr:hypothetical protein AAP_02636 [Ascosphaera apis ARSEF 7405]